MDAWTEESPLANRQELNTSCLPCFKRHIKCERRIPCLRCIRLGLHCEPNPNPRGRPKKDSSGNSGSLRSSTGSSHSHAATSAMGGIAPVPQSRRLVPPEHGQEMGSSDPTAAIPDTRESLNSLAALVTAGDVEADRARRLLTAWRTCLARRGWTALSNQLEEMARVMRIPNADIPTHSMLADARMWDEDRQMQLFQERFDDVDGSATCKVSYRFGEVTISTSPRFAAMYMNGQEIEDTMTRTGLRPELVWKSLFSPENGGAFFDLLNRACFQHGEFGGETSDILKCIDRYELKLSCLVRVRVFVSSAGGAAICMLLLLPLEPSRHLQDVL